MKRKFLIILIAVIGILSFYLIPPNVAGYACNELEIIDLHCHIVGMNFLGIKFATNYWYLNDIEIYDKGCGGVLAHPGKMYTCPSLESFWGLPPEYARALELEKYEDRKEIGITIDDLSGNSYEFFFADICSDAMIHHLIKHSNIQSPSEELIIEKIPLPPTINSNDFDRCADSTQFTKSRANMAQGLK